MRTLDLSRHALSISAATALLAGCGGSQPPIGAPGTMSQTRALAARGDSSNYKVVYSFSRGSDGANPDAGLIDVSGTLYGTTVAGGTDSGSGCYTFYSGCGTVFSVTPAGTEKVLHSFGVGSDGKNPQAGLVDVDGTLYGTTTLGGAYTCGSACGLGGTVFSITRSGTENVLHSFTGYTDGSNPFAGLINVKGKLYGTTENGGTPICYSGSNPGCGTVFSITTAGTERVLHDFGGAPDGAWPDTGLIEAKGDLYGTTRAGGTHGEGTVFSITPGGQEKVLHSFGHGADGRTPSGSLIEANGTLYGTTATGGANGDGTVFSLSPGGTEKVLHNFDGADGKGPSGSLIDVKGKLYGTTGGGTYGYGTVFSITPGGKEKVLHSFGNGADGRGPNGSLIDANGTLYGTTTEGGANYYGTVFSLKP